MRIFAIDTETTGLFKSHAISLAVIELRLIQCEGVWRFEKEGEVFHELFNPCKPIDWRATKVHGYSDSMLAHKPKITDFSFCRTFGIDEGERVCFLGHNLSFDLGTLKRTADERDFKLFDHPGKAVCTLSLAKKYMKGDGYKLGVLVDRLLTYEPEHAANLAKDLDFDLRGFEHQSHDAYHDALAAVFLANHILHGNRVQGLILSNM